MVYSVLLADPPWRYRTWSETNQKKSARQHYELMELDAIKALPVAPMCAADCVLFMWACNPMIPQALEVITAWGFTFKTVAFTWAKQSTTGAKWHMGLGYWTRQNTEQCFLATRGKPKVQAHDVRQLLISPRREHSRKPDEQYAAIERLTTGNRVELFARHRRDGWDQLYSNQADVFSQQPQAQAAE